MFILTMFDVGQGESFLIDFPSGDFAVIDGGPAANGPALGAVQKRVADGRTFRWAMATQWDADHVRGLVEVVTQYPPAEVIWPGVDVSLLDKLVAAIYGEEDAAVVRAFKQAVTKNDIHVAPAWAREPVPGSDSSIAGWYLSPSRKVHDEIVDAIDKRASIPRLKELGNRASIVTWFNAYQRTIFLPGEIESDQYDEAREQFRRRRGGGTKIGPQADLLKLSHHGSINNNPVELFQFFAKRGAIGLVSAGGRYGHPSPVSLHRFHDVAQGIPFCTNLGQPCSALIGEGLTVKDDLVNWARGRDLVRIRNPKEKCFGEVRVSVSPAAGLKVEATDIQLACPFGAPPTMPLVRRGRRKP